MPLKGFIQTMVVSMNNERKAKRKSYFESEGWNSESKGDWKEYENEKQVQMCLRVFNKKWRTKDPLGLSSVSFLE